MWQEVWLLTIEINGKGFRAFDTMYWYFLSFSGENRCWTHFFCINFDIMLVSMHFAFFISHYAGFGTRSKLSKFWVASDSLWVEPLIRLLSCTWLWMFKGKSIFRWKKTKVSKRAKYFWCIQLFTLCHVLLWYQRRRLTQSLRIFHKFISFWLTLL